MWNFLTKWDFFKVLVGGYMLVSSIVLVMFMFARCPEAGGGELGMLMYFISAPAGVFTGIFLNYINYMNPQSVFSSLPGRVQLFMVWLPFFIGGLIQWGTPYLIVQLLIRNQKKCRTHRYQDDHEDDTGRS